MYKISIIFLFSYISRYLKISHTQPQSEHKSLTSLFNSKQKLGMERDNQQTYANRDVLLHHLYLNFNRVWQPVDVCQLRRLTAPPLLEP